MQAANQAFSNAANWENNDENRNYVYKYYSVELQQAAFHTDGNYPDQPLYEPGIGVN